MFDLLNIWYDYRWSGWASEVDIDLDTVGDGDGCDFFDLLGCAFQVDISLEDGHGEGIPCLWALSTWSSSGADT